MNDCLHHKADIMIGENLALSWSLMCQQSTAATGKNPSEVGVTTVTGDGLRRLYVLSSSSIHREEIKYHVDATDSISMMNTPIHMVLGIIHCGS